LTNLRQCRLRGCRKRLVNFGARSFIACLNCSAHLEPLCDFVDGDFAAKVGIDLIEILLERLRDLILGEFLVNVNVIVLPNEIRGNGVPVMSKLEFHGGSVTYEKNFEHLICFKNLFISYQS